MCSFGCQHTKLFVSTVQAQLTSAQPGFSKTLIHIQTKNLGEKFLDLPLPKGFLPHLNHIALMFPLFHHTSIRKVNCNTPKREGSSEIILGCVKIGHRSVALRAPKPRFLHPPQGPEQRLGLHIHLGTRTHTHTASVCNFFS